MTWNVSCQIDSALEVRWGTQTKPSDRQSPTFSSDGLRRVWRWGWGKDEAATWLKCPCESGSQRSRRLCTSGGYESGWLIASEVMTLPFLSTPNRPTTHCSVKPAPKTAPTSWRLCCTWPGETPPLPSTNPFSFTNLPKWICLKTITK